MTKGPSTYRDEVANVVPDVDPHSREQRCGAMEQSWFSPDVLGPLVVYKLLARLPPSTYNTRPTNSNRRSRTAVGFPTKDKLADNSGWSADQQISVPGAKMNALCRGHSVSKPQEHDLTPRRGPGCRNHRHGESLSRRARWMLIFARLEVQTCKNVVTRG